MSRFQARTILVLVLLGVSIVLLVAGALLEPVRNVLLFPISLLQRGVAGVWGEPPPAQPPDAESLRAINATLEAEVTTLQAEVVRLRESEAQIGILSSLLNYARSQPSNRYLAANVIGRDPSAFLTYLILDRGSNDGLRRDMPVVTEQGLVGRIVEVTSNAAKVLPITDPTSAVNARLQTSREEGVAVGTVGGGLEMQFVSQRAAIAPGELVLTSGLGGKFPPGIVLGSVTAVQRLEYEVLQKADLSPAVPFGQLQIVLIIINFTPADFSPFFQATPTAAAPAP